MASDLIRRVRRGLVVGTAAAGLVAGAAALAPAPAQAAITGDVQLTGHGWGHGRGLGQWGAYGYAVNSGWTSTQILAHYYGGTTLGQQNNVPISVLLSGQDGRDLVVTSGKDFVVGGVRVGGGSAARVQARSDGSYLLSTSYGCTSPIAWSTPITDPRVLPTVDPGNDLTAMLSLCTDAGTKQYRGELSVVWAGTTERTVNNVLMEDYLRGVVPRESPASWGDGGGGQGMQALGAQAVAARSYAYAEGRYTYAKTCDTTSCQVYLGAGTNYGGLEDARTDRAVANTAGVVLRGPAGGIVRAEFSSSTGGYTAGGGFPAVPDDGDVVSPHHNWSQTVPAAQIATAFGVGELVDLQVTARNGLGQDGGRVTKVTVTGTAKTVTVTGNDVRTQLGLKSDWFSVAAVTSTPTPTTPTTPVPPAGPALPTLYLASGNTARPSATSVPFGDAGDVPLTCDWNGDGIDEPGVFRNGTWLLSAKAGGPADVRFDFGQAGDQPVCGDWDGDGKDSAGLYRNGVVYLRNSLTTGIADGQYFFGAPGDTLVAGDWNGDGYDTPGIWRAGAFFLTQSNIVPHTDVVLAYGGPGDLPVVGDWDRNGTDTVGVFRSGAFLLRNANTAGPATLTVPFGQAGDRPLAGAWSAGSGSVVGVSRGY